jgi:hypothetical protein
VPPPCAGRAAAFDAHSTGSASAATTMTTAALIQPIRLVPGMAILVLRGSSLLLMISSTREGRRNR